jgi:hypothetical protein
MKPVTAVGILLGACLLYLASTLWAFLGCHYIFEFFYNRWLYAENAASWTDWFCNITAPDYTGVSHPFLALFWIIAHKIFGMNQFAYLALNIGLHCTNSFLVYILVRRFFLASTRLSLVSALFFLTSSIAWPTMIEWYSGIYRHLTLLFYLLGLLAFLHTASKGKGGTSLGALALYSMGFLTYHDVLSFPLLLGMIAFVVPYAKDPRAFRQTAWSTVIFSFLLTAGFLWYVHIVEGLISMGHFEFGWHSIKYLIAIPREVIAHFLIPRPLWGLPNFPFARIVPLVFISILACVLLFLGRNVQTKVKEYRSLILLGLGWILVTALPYLSIAPTSSEWAWLTRYFYFPSVGICILVAVIFDMLFCTLGQVLSFRPLRDLLIVGVLGYFVVFGTTSTILRGQLCRLMSTKYVIMGQQEAELTYGLFRESAPLMLGPGGHVYLTVYNAPLSRARLRVFMDHFNQEMLLGSKKCEVVLLQTEANTKDLDAPHFQISFEDGKWGKITRSS